MDSYTILREVRCVQPWCCWFLGLLNIVYASCKGRSSFTSKAIAKRHNLARMFYEQTLCSLRPPTETRVFFFLFVVSCFAVCPTELGHHRSFQRYRLVITSISLSRSLYTVPSIITLIPLTRRRSRWRGRVENFSSIMQQHRSFGRLSVRPSFLESPLLLWPHVNLM